MAQAPSNADVPASSTSDPVEKRIGNISSAWDLGAKIYDKVVEVTQQSAASREKAKGAHKILKGLKNGLGEWLVEAQDNFNGWRQPYLGNDAFWKHLVKNDGRLKPSGTSTATFDWAQLLFALDIRPGQKIISWRTLPPGFNPAGTGILPLAIDGSVLRHIINLFALYKSGKRVADIYQFKFGTLNLEDPNQNIYSFTGLGDQELASEKLPFCYNMQDMKGSRIGNIPFERGFFEIQYQQALNSGVSDLHAELLNPRPGEISPPLQARVDSLLNAMRLITEIKWEKPWIISPSWVEDASRIKRRVTSEREDLLVQKVIDCLSRKLDLVEELKSEIRKPDQWQKEVDFSIRSLCMTEGGQFKFEWNDPKSFPSLTSSAFDVALKNELSWILEESWIEASIKRDYVSPKTLLDVLSLPHVIVNKPVIVHHAIPGNWEFIGQIGH